EPSGLVRMAAPLARPEVVVYRALARIENDIVYKYTTRTALEQGVALAVVRIQVAGDDDAGHVVVHERALGMLPGLAVRGMRQSFADDVVAVGDVVRGCRAPLVRRRAGEALAGRRQVLVGCPGERAVVDDDVGGAVERRQPVALPAGMLGKTGLAGSHAQVLDDDVARAHVDAAADQRDAGRRRRLAGNRDVRISQFERVAGQIDHPADLEYDHPRHVELDRRLQRPFAVGGQRRDANDAPAATTRRPRRSRAVP